MDHQGTCHTFPTWKTMELSDTLILIDVDKWRLTVMRPQDYVALSYVWGRIPNILESTKANFESLQRKGALSSTELSARLPTTVYDAIVLTKAMGQQYLWVDRLCIVQDDFENKKAQLDRMASIYARSYYTIVAADGIDADHGLRGVPGTYSPRNLQQKMYQFSKRCVMMQVPESESNLDPKEWHRRGWTFQERTLSHRNLVFFQDQVFWECRRCTWIEDLADIPEGADPLRVSKRKPADPHDLQYYKWPDLHQYANLAYRYNRRLLGFQSDALNAFAAVTQVLSRSFPGGFLHGLPEYFFDYALLWLPIFAQDKRTCEFPSWSWVSQACDMTFMYYNTCDQIFVKKGSLWLAPRIELTPMVEWFKKDIDTGHKHKINNSYNAHQIPRNDPNCELPPGWKRHFHQQSHPRLERDEENFAWFRNDDHGGEWGTPFVYPIPIAEEPLRHTAGNWSNYLHFTTTRRYLVAGKAMRGRYESGGRGLSSYWNAEVPGCLVFSLLDEAGKYVGHVRSGIIEESDMPTGEICEAIVLSAGVAREDKWGSTKAKIMELALQDELKALETYEFYNVMWIEREDGIAYRKAVGRVWKTTWDAGPSERVDIVLG
ncbi:HET-domain-containing protein [Ophiobolus disseminans]|uniref:HET-domain-containing protein n=1 Tax=Ophiobolus disseminans TaxID=1469910 RepID=A0A6A6ZQ14_9PLEO|nr:HET-domain-containing protein [Ophiobolus disseminans]